MKNRKVALLTLSLSILITSNPSQAKQTQPISDVFRIDNMFNNTYEWFSLYRKPHETQLELSTPLVVAGILCFIAASISSAGGIGGGGLFIPILTLVAGLDLRIASSLSAFMVTGGSVANVMYNLCIKGSTKFGGKSLIDYDIALLSEPCMLLGVSLGVICNLVFPEWLITVLFALFLVWTTSMSCRNGLVYWKMESEVMKMRNGCDRLENGLTKDGAGDETEGNRGVTEPLLGVRTEENCMLRFPWMKMGVLILVWCSFCLVYLLRGNRYGQGIIPIEPCGVGYWVLSASQIPLAIVYTVWILCRKENLQHHTLNTQKDIEDLNKVGPSNKLVFPLMALLAGILGGVFGIGGGMLISPLLLQVGIAPEVTAATCSFMVFFSSSMSAFQYLLLGMEHADTALIFAVTCFVASLLGLVVLQRAIKVYGRASLIVFSVSIVMALSTVLMTSFGALHVWSDYKSGRYMGFKLPC
ncbi:putative transmembrane protein TauE [Rosa chinensis]|uniref:Putative transmembrane protein TauE n=1 Tax=Rosa chinensis TaxID=74649 RepID=A0A2P6Q349_ROSCH|nr:sulfite exporter TauE/SafE family protein 2 [Rosa chinensis]PRQ28569.1 putative transmembrane protein TauE [Rosa chinensis]